MNPVRTCKIWWAVFLVAEWVHAAPVDTPSASWLTQAQQELAQREYRASSTDRGLQAPNRAQGFRTCFDAEGVSLVTRDAEAAPLVGLRLIAYGSRLQGRVAAGRSSLPACQGRSIARGSPRQAFHRNLLTRNHR